MIGKRVVAVVGDANDINCWSNIPFYFLQAGKRSGFFQEGLAIDFSRLRPLQFGWNLLAPLRGERYGGFQYTLRANLAMSRQVDWSEIGEVISHAQLFPPYELLVGKSIQFSHYIDLPLPCLFREYQLESTVGARTLRNALARELDQYAASKLILCMSEWAAKQVMERCAISESKVRVLIPGANLPDSLIDELLPRYNQVRSEVPDGIQIPLRIAFVGKDTRRKGLERLVGAVRILRSRGRRVTIRVIGPQRSLFPEDPEIENVGFINKQQDSVRFLHELFSCHMGALPSHEEAFGIAALEYLRCGLPSLLTRTGGLGDSIPEGCAVVLHKDCSPEDIADVLQDLLVNPDRFSSMRKTAQQNALYASWDRTLEDLKHIWTSVTTV